MQEEFPSGRNPNFTEFFELFRKHWNKGTGLQRHDKAAAARGDAWTTLNFINAMGKHAVANLDNDTLKSWLDGTRWPRETNKNAILNVYFGPPNSPDADAAGRKEMSDVWEKGNKARSLPGRRTKPRPPPPANPPADANWTPEQPFTLREGLARLYIHRNQGEASGNTIALDVTVEAGRTYITIEATEDTPKVDATFAISAAEIVVLRDLHVTPVPDTTLGTPKCPHPNVIYASSWLLKVPDAGDGAPGGILLAGERLRQYQTVEGLPYGIRIELRCRDIDLKSTDEVALPNVSEKQRAMLRRVLQRHEADPNNGMICLARAELSADGGGGNT